MSKHLISVIIPYYGNWNLTHARLGELYKFISDPIEIILVNDASPEIDCKTMPAFWQKLNIQHTIKYVENKENLGFGGSHNRGAKVATGDILVFLSNDVVISGKFIGQIEGIVDSHAGNVMIGNQVLYHDTGWNTIEIKGKKSIVTYPVGYLIACTKEMWKRFGGFDPIYSPYDYEDVDIGAWCLYNDIPMVALNNSNIKHLSEQTVRKLNPNREEHTLKNGVLFREKWTELLKSKFP